MVAASAGGGSACNNVSAAERSRQMGPNSIGGRSRDRSNDSNGHNSDDDTVLSGVEEEDGNNLDHGSSADGKTKARKKKTRTVFSRSQVSKIDVRIEFFLKSNLRLFFLICVISPFFFKLSATITV